MRHVGTCTAAKARNKRVADRELMVAMERGQVQLPAGAGALAAYESPYEVATRSRG